MREIREIVSASQRLAQEGREAVLATVVRTRGSTYRKAGARMLVTESEWVAGAISGGCLEQDLLRKAWWRTESGRALVTYDGAGGDADEISWGFGLGCDGSVDVLLERLRPGLAVDPIAPLRAAVERRQRSVIATVPEGLGRLVLADGGAVHSDLPPVLRERVTAEAQAVLSGAASELEHAYYELVAPPHSLVIFGSNYDALPMVHCARALGWDVTVVEKRPTASTQRRFQVADRIVTGRAPEVVPRALGDGAPAVVVMTHHYEEDRELLRVLLEHETAYLGVLGPRVRTERLLDELQACPVQRERVHGPIGLDLGGRAPEDVALSVIAEVQAKLHGRSAGSLRARQ